MKYLILSIIWSGYCILHSFLISISFTRFITRILKNYYAFYRLFYVLISILLLIPIIIYTYQLDSPIIITYDSPWSILRSILMWGSLFIIFRAFFFSYDPLSFFGIRQIQNFGKPHKPPAELSKVGLLGVIRHPMYFAFIIFLWTQTFRLADIVVNIILTIYIIIGTILEEKKLVLEFGNTYVKYQREVPMLIPFTKIK